MDVTPPAEVTDLAAEAGSSMVTLTWTAPDDADFDHYEVWYGTDGTADTQFTGTIDPAGTEILNLTNDIEYTFLVKTVDNESSVSPGAEVIGTPYLPEVTDLAVVVGSSQVTLTWTNPTVVGFDHCEVWYGTGGTADTQFTGTVDAEGTVITGLTNWEI